MKVAFSSILLFVLVIPFVMTYRLSPGSTPYWLFSLIFLALGVYLVLDLSKIKGGKYSNLKQIVLWIVIAAVIGSAFVSAIVVRHQTAPIYGVHDIILQQEAAIRLLIHGKNPYSETYFGTPLELWHYSDTETNPALYHFVMGPFYLLFALPFYFLSNHTIGYFDARIPLLFLFILALFLAAKLVKDIEKRQIFIILLAFNPAILGYTLEGRSDFFMFPFLFVGMYLLYKQKYFLSGIPIALAFAIKQSAWPLFPFYFLYLFFKTKNISKTLRLIIPFLITFGVITAPFLFWNSKAFIDSTILYLSGSASQSYPVSGYGLGKLLNEIGVIKNLNTYYPFIIWQVLIGVPVFLYLARFLKKSPSVSRLILVYGIFLFVYWYLSRYFNNSHLGYLSVVFTTAYFWPEEENNQ